VGLSNNEIASSQCAQIIKSYPIERASPKTSAVICSLRRKIRDNNLCVSKADKGNSIVIQDRSGNDNKVMTFINDNSGKKVTFNFQNYCASVRKQIKSCEFVIDRNHNYLISMNPRLPRLYGLPKIHKSNIPIRTIVSFISTPTYRLCQYLDKWFKNAAQFRPRYSLSNTSDLIT